jgi:hypothetical protein
LLIPREISGLGCKREAIADSIKRLDNIEWITTNRQLKWNPRTHKRTRTIAKTLGLAVNPDKLPRSEDKVRHSRPSTDAKWLAAQHTGQLLKLSLGKNQHKNFDRQQEQAAQRLIDELGSLEGAVDVVNFAMGNARYHKAARKSLYELRTRLAAIKETMAEQQPKAVVA